MVFWSHHISPRTIRRITAAVVSPLRRCLTLPRDANIHSILVEYGLPSFENLRAVSTVRFIQSFRLNQQPQPITHFFRSLRDHSESKIKSRLLIHHLVSRYSEDIGCSTFDTEPLPAITAIIRTNQQLCTSNINFRSIRTALNPALYLSCDDPSTAATRANLRSGHRLNAWRHGKSSPTDQCLRCNQRETIDHILLNCSAYTSIRHFIEAAFLREFGQSHLMSNQFSDRII